MDPNPQPQYTCICGKTFMSKQAYVAHSGWCDMKHTAEELQQKRASHKAGCHAFQKDAIKVREDEYARAPRLCLYCQRPLTYDERGKTFCNSSCAASYNNAKFPKRAKEKETRELSYKETCPYCEQRFATKSGVLGHISVKHRAEYEQTPFILSGRGGEEAIALDISIKDMQDYIQTHRQCEICGKSVEDIQRDPGHINSLCIDHEHPGNHFRGLLCMSCNRSLGWLENNRDAALLYLTRNQHKI